MQAILNGQTAWAVVIIALAVACSVITVAVIWNFALRRARLPDATRYEDLKERAATTEVNLRRKEELLREVDQRIQGRDRVAAEVAALTERLENLHAEFAALAGAEQQIEAIKQRAAEAAGAFAIETGKLDEVKQALQETAAQLPEAQSRLGRLQKEADELEVRIGQSRETLLAKIAELNIALVELTKQKNSLDLEISDLKGARESLYAARAETAALAAQNDALVARYHELRDELSGRSQEIKDQFKQLDNKRDAMEKKITQLQMARDVLLAAREEFAAITARNEAVRREIELARQTRDDLLNGRELADARQELVQVGEDVSMLRASRASLEQMATKAVLESEIERLRLVVGNTSGDQPDVTTISADLAQLPSCLRAGPFKKHDTQLENQALFDVEQHSAAVTDSLAQPCAGICRS